MKPLTLLLVMLSLAGPVSAVQSKTFTVSGRVLRPPSQPDTGTTTVALNGGTTPAQSSVKADGTFEFAKVRPGAYTLSVRPAPQFQPIPIVVVNEDVTDIQVRIPLLVTITGIVSVEGGGPCPAVSLSFAPYIGGSMVPAATSSTTTSGTSRTAFTVKLNEGEYRILWNQLPAGYAIKSIVMGSDDLLVQPLQIANGKSATVAITLGVTAPSPWVKVSGDVLGIANLATSPAGSRGAEGPRVTLSRESALPGFNAAAAPLPAPAVIDAHGHFEFPMVLPGIYRATVASSSTGVAPTSIVVSNKDLANVQIFIPATREIEGRVLVERNGPLPRLSLTFRNPAVSTASFTTAPTLQSDGTFKVTLPEIDLSVTVNETSLPTGYSLKSFTYGAVNLLRDPLRGLWPDTELRLTFAVEPDSWFKIAGTVTGLATAPGARLEPRRGAPQTATIVLTGTPLSRLVSGSGSVTAPIGRDGAFEFPGIFPGEYTAQVNPSPRGVSAIAIVVRDKDVTGLKIAIPGSKQVAGRVLVERSGPVPRFAFTLANSMGTSVLINVTPKADGGFSLTLPEGAYRLAIEPTTLPPGYTAKSLTYGVVDLLRDPLKLALPDIAELRVNFATAANSWFKIAGTVAGLENIPVPPGGRGALPVVVLSGTPLSRFGQNATLTAVLGPDGSFRFVDLFPGEYTARLNPSPSGVLTTTVVVKDKDVAGVRIVIPQSK